MRCGGWGIERSEADEGLIAEIEERAGLADLRREIVVALAALSDPVREAVELRVVDELPYPDVAKRLGIAEPAARARVSRGLHALADALDTPATKEALT